jgi:hypothetical protein
MALQALIMPLVAVLKGSGFGQATKALKGLDGEFKQVAKSAAFAAINFAAAGSIQKLTAYMDEAVTVTQRYERNILALNQTFAEQSGQMRAFTQDAVSMGISQSQAAQASVFLGSVLKQYGLETSVTATETKKLISLSQDLATTYGYDLQEALLAMTALFRGEYDPIEKFGVAMKQNEINALLAERGQSKLTGTMEFQAQVQARLDLLYMRSNQSLGAFARATDTLYVAQSRLNAVMSNQQIAFGTPLQKPLTDVTNMFAEFAETVTPAMSDFGDAFAQLGNFFAPAIKVSLDAIAVSIAGLGDAVGLVNQFFKTSGSTFESANYELEKMMDKFPFLSFLAEAFFGEKKDSRLVEAFKALTYQLYLTQLMSDVVRGKFLDVDESARTASVALRRVAGDAKNLAAKNARLAAEGVRVTNLLRDIGTTADDATGKTSALTSIFDELDDVIAQSEAKEALEGLGLSAGLIEKVLTEPNWAEIFGHIANLARLTAIDLTKIMSVTAAAGISNQILESEAFLGSLKLTDTKVKDVASNNDQKVTTIFDELKKSVMQQTARAQLEQMTNSEGLINMILGREDWLSLWIKIKKSTTLLSELEDQFYKTGAGVQELADAIQAWKDYDDAVEAVNLRLEATIANIVKQAEDLKLAFSDLLIGLDVLPTIAMEMGRFESAIVSQLASIEASLQSAFRNGDLFEEGYNALRKFAREELAILQARQRQRDDMASRLSFSQEVIKEYTEAFTGAMRLTALFNSLKDETEKRTVTEVTTGVAKLGKSLKEFNVIVTREYEETITKVMDKTAGLLDGFKVMAQKSKDFANNLRTLKDMGLDGMLFDQLVSAGVEAGGETAQALVDGGQETVSEISSIFAEVNALGATLGEEVATTLYGTGIDLADGLIEGILSKQEEMETAAYAMAEAFNKAFQATLSTEVGKVTESRKDIEKALAEAEIDKIPIPDMPRPIDSSALDEINNLIAGANKALSGKLSSVFREGVTGKLGAFEALKADIVSGQLTDLGGVTRNLTSAKLENVATATGGTTVNNYYEIKAGTRSETLKTVETLASFTNQNGTLKTFVTTQ